MYEVLVSAACLPASAAKAVRKAALGRLNRPQKLQLEQLLAQQRVWLDGEQDMAQQQQQQAATRAAAMLEYGQGLAAHIEASRTDKAAVTRQHGKIDNSVIRDSSLALWLYMGVSAISKAITVFSSRRAECREVSTRGSKGHIGMTNQRAVQLCQGVLDGVVAELQKPPRAAVADAIKVLGKGLAALAPAAAVVMPDMLSKMLIALDVASGLSHDEVVAVGIFNQWLTGEYATSGQHGGGGGV